MISLDPSLRALVLLLLLVSGASTSSPITLFETEVKGNGFKMETHTVETADFFFLTVFRLGGLAGINSGGKPLLLTHGLDESADIYILNAVEKSLGFVLAQHGYDVWLMNNRGTAYSRGHRKFNVKQREFWDFSFQEMGEFDIPAALEYISRVNQVDKITIIGHSQGATQAFAALSDPITANIANSKIKAVVGLSPAVDFSSADFVRQQVFKAVKMYVPLRKMLGIHYPFFSSSTNTWFKDFMRWTCAWSETLCEGIMYVPGLNPKCNDSKLLGKLLSVLPAGASFRSYSHFEQLYGFRSSTPALRKFDFGSKEENLLRYQSEAPPVYDWNLVHVPILIHSGYEDTLTPFEDIIRLTEHLKNVGKRVKTTLHRNWDHFSPMMSPDPSEVFRGLLKDLEEVYN